MSGLPRCSSGGVCRPIVIIFSVLYVTPAIFAGICGLPGFSGHCLQSITPANGVALLTQSCSASLVGSLPQLSKHWCRIEYLGALLLTLTSRFSLIRLRRISPVLQCGSPRKLLSTPLLLGYLWWFVPQFRSLLFHLTCGLVHVFLFLGLLIFGSTAVVF